MVFFFAVITHLLGSHALAAIACFVCAHIQHVSNVQFNQHVSNVQFNQHVSNVQFNQHVSNVQFNQHV